MREPMFAGIVLIAVAAIAVPTSAHPPESDGSHTTTDRNYFYDDDNLDDVDGLYEAGASELARESSNPLGRLWLLNSTFDNRWRDGDITDKLRRDHTWTFQPVIPMPLKEGWIVVNRPILPIVLDRQVPTGPNQFDSESGELGDLVFLTALGRNLPMENKTLGPGDLTVGAGLNFSFPTATVDRLGSEKYTIGPGAVAAYMGQKAVLGGLYQHFVDFAGRSRRDDVNLSLMQLFYWLNFPGGWQVGGSPIISANWESDSTDDRWNVPIGLGVRKLLFLGKLPVRVGVIAEWSAVHQDTFGDRWNIKFDITPVIPSLVKWPWVD